MMAKLYWRVKLNGKWTWRPADVIFESEDGWIQVECIMEEEE